LPSRAAAIFWREKFVKAIILAAGRGSRMRALTEDRPKCLVELAGTSLLDLQLKALRGGGIDEVAIVRGYRGDMLARPGLEFFDNPRWAESNMVVSLCAARDWLLREPCIVSYSDIFFPAETVRRLAAAHGDLVISYDPEWLNIWGARFPDPLADAETFRREPDGRVSEIGGKASSVGEIQGQYMGLLRFTPSSWCAVEDFLGTLESPQRDRLDMTSMLSRLIARGLRIDAVPTAPGWGEVDSESDLAYYAGEIAAGRLAPGG
jgi:choline kinase